MKRLRAYKYELQPNGEQIRKMRRFAGSCRFVFNRALALQAENRKSGEKKIGYVGLCKEITGWRHNQETAWLANAPIHPLQQALKDLETAYANFFARRARFPNFRKKNRNSRFRYPDPKQIKLDQVNSRIFLPKLGWVQYRNSRVALGDVKNVTIRLEDGRWFASIQTEREVEVPIHKSTSVIGIDLGIRRFATLSDGSFLAPLGSFRKHEEALAKEQRKLKSMKGPRDRKNPKKRQAPSNNWKKQQGKVAKIHYRIACARRDYLHKATTTICKNHAVAVVEDLRVRNMSASASGTVEKPGRNVRQKAGLNKAILDQGWGEFRRQLEYKMEWAGGQVIKVPPQYTSQECPTCRYMSKGNRKTQESFSCENCGFAANADHVGAINVERAGLARMACGSNGALTPSEAGTRRGDLLHA